MVNEIQLFWPTFHQIFMVFFRELLCKPVFNYSTYRFVFSRDLRTFVSCYKNNFKNVTLAILPFTRNKLATLITKLPTLLLLKYMKLRISYWLAINMKEKTIKSQQLASTQRTVVHFTTTPKQLEQTKEYIRF